MAKYNNKEAFYARLQQLAETKKPIIKETRTIGTLIDFERASDGMAYGIIKENHHFYIKKGGIKEKPDVADFAYIGGTENITNFQYGSLFEAEKKRNLLLISINESGKLKTNKTSSKIYINEDIAGDEIGMAKNKLGSLDAASAAEAQPQPQPEMGSEMPVVPDLGDNDSIPPVGTDVAADGLPDAGAEGNPNMGGSEEPAPEAGLEMPDAGTEPEAGTEPDAGMEAGMGGEENEVNREITKALGKLTNTLRKTEMTPVETKSYINTFLSAFKDKLPEVEIEDRKEMANKIMKTVGDSESDLESSMPDETGVEEGQCTECGGFGAYAESRGYNKEAFMECDNAEKASVISGYKLAEADGEVQNDDDTIGMLANTEIAEALSNDYGHEEYVSEILNPMINKMSEGTDEDKQIKINELSWGSMKDGHVLAKNATPTTVAKVSTDKAIMGESLPVDKGNSGVNLQENEDDEHEETETPGEEAAEHEFGGDEFGAKEPETIEEPEMPETPEITDEPEISTEPEIGFSSGSQNLGIAGLEPKGAATGTIDISVDGNTKMLNIQMSESEKKVRNYIHKRLEENAGLRKPSLNESVKSEKMKQLDKLIDAQFELNKTMKNNKKK